LRLLDNLINSIQRFYPQFDRLVIDDGSGDAVDDYLTGLAGAGEIAYTANRYKYLSPTLRGQTDQWLKCLGPDEPSQRTLVQAGSKALASCDAQAPMATRHGMLYPHIRLALHYALAKGYDYLWLVQSDMQMVFGREDLLGEIDAIAQTRSTMIGVCPVMVHRCNPPGLVWDAALGVYRGPRAFVATGLYRLAPIRNQPDMIDEVQDCERQSSHAWHTRGFEIGYLKNPVVAHVPWPESKGIAAADAEDSPPLIQPVIGQRAWTQRDPAVLPLADYAIKTTYPTRLPGPPYWYNETYLERFVELCLGQARANHPPAQTVPRAVEQTNAPRMAHYWQPPEQAAPAAIASPARPIRGWLKRSIPLLKTIKQRYEITRRNQRVSAKLVAYTRFHKQVLAERDWLWGNETHDAIDGDGA